MGRAKGYRKPKEHYLKEYRYEIYLLSMGNSVRLVARISGHIVNTITKLKKYI